jgi:hypothetical protein
MPLTGDSTFGTGGWDIGGSAGFRFGRHWVAGLTLDHAVLNGDAANSNGVTTNINTTMFGANFSFIGNPDRVSFFAQIGLGGRWYNVTNHSSTTDLATGIITDTKSSRVYSGVAYNGALGIWIAIGRSVRLLPEATLSVTSLSSDTAPGAAMAVFTLALAGFYNLNL